MYYFILFLLIYVSVVVVVSIFLSRILSKVFPKIKYGIYLLIFILAGLAVTPMPMHGGFSFLLFDLIDEARREFENHIDDRKKQDIQHKIISRFSGKLDVEVGDRNNTWSIVHVNDQVAFFDHKSGLLWTREIGQINGYNESTLSLAEKLCQNIKPHGYWVLPNDAEAFYIWKNKGQTYFNDGLNIWLVRVVISDDQTAVVGMTQLEHLGKKNPPQVFGVRCVALSKTAPREGYLTKNIPLGEWNEYQLSKNK